MFRPLSPARGGSHRQRFGFKLHEDRRSTDTSHDFEDSTNWRGVGRRQAVKHKHDHPGESGKESKEPRLMSLPTTSTIRNEGVPEGTSGNLRTTGSKVTWAEVVQNTASDTRNQRKVKIVTRAFSRNNPVN
jgi:hypothetical protein